jgi:hypothetical protein
MYRFVAFILLVFISCTAPTPMISYTSRALPVYAVDPLPQKIILLNTYKAAEKNTAIIKKSYSCSLLTR